MGRLARSFKGKIRCGIFVSQGRSTTLSLACSPLTGDKVFCISCGTRLPDTARFCSSCGTPQTAGTADSPPVVDSPKLPAKQNRDIISYSPPQVPPSPKDAAEKHEDNQIIDGVWRVVKSIRTVLPIGEGVIDIKPPLTKSAVVVYAPEERLGYPIDLREFLFEQFAYKLPTVFKVNVGEKIVAGRRYFVAVFPSVDPGEYRAECHVRNWQQQDEVFAVEGYPFQVDWRYRS